MRPARILLLADTHLGFDLPFKPRIERRRRGDDFFANYERALQPALRGEVDAVVHGGDLLYRSKVPPRLVRMAMDPLFAVADQGVPVLVVPGNHERAHIPYPLLAAHRDVHIFDRPQTVWLQCQGLSVGFSGFPFQRAIRHRFRGLVDQTGFDEKAADARFLCLHQAVEGARVGPIGYTFRDGYDVVRGRDISAGFAAVLTGHIHRAQVLRTDLTGRELGAPVVYPGSIERVSFAEKDEEKGYVIVELRPESRPGSAVSISFVRLPARPMVTVELDGTSCGSSFSKHLETVLESVAENSVVRLRLKGPIPAGVGDALSAAKLRKMVPPSVNISLSMPRNLV